MKSSKIDGWYRAKTYPHLDFPLKFEDAERLVKNQSRVISHSFLPFMGFVDSKRRFSPGNVSTKDRPIKYCSHVDGAIHSYYSYLLSSAYESYLVNKSWKNCVIGYRTGKGTNIHMAKNAFQELSKRESSTAIAIDISDFFGSIEHSTLIANIKRVLGVPRLTKDWFRVVRSMTSYSWVDSTETQQLLGLNPKDLPRPLCKIRDFRNLRVQNPNFIKKNLDPFGIPQGSPLSAVMSNVFMIDFDKVVFRFVKSIGGYYRRYSDDIFIVCEHGEKDKVYDFVSKEIKKLGQAIEIKDQKTEISNFHTGSDGELICDVPITYLGFTFDGKRTLLRSRTLSRYYRRMTYATRRAATAARNSGNGKVFKRKLKTQFTHQGQSNFYSYARRASKILGDEMPKRQLRNHEKVLNRKIISRGK